MTWDESLEKGRSALLAGRWQDARDCFDAVLGEQEVPEAMAHMGDALFWLGEMRRAIEYRERAYASFRRAGDVLGAGESAIWLCLMYEVSLGNMPAARGWLARAESVLSGVEAGPLRGWMHLSHAAHSSDLPHCKELIEQALAIARGMADTDLELCALAELGVLLVKMGEVEQGLACLDEAMAGALGGDRATFDTVVFTSCSMLTACDIVSDLERASQWTRAADEFTQAYGGPYLYANCRVVYARVLMARGNWPEAERELLKAIVSTREAFPAMHNRAVVSLAELRLRQGRRDEAETLIESMDDPLGSSVVAANIALERGKADVAAALIERWLNSAAEHPSGPLHAGGPEISVETAAALCLLAESYLAAGNIELASSAADRLAELASATRGAQAHALGSLAAGRLAQARDGDEAAAALFEQAVERFARLGLPLETARSRLCLARALALSKPELAAVEARGALTAFDRLGASGDADIAASLLRTWGIAGRTGPRKLGLLTRREQEILNLIAEGLSNQEIAGRLFISRKTAAHHVSNLLAKLGARNRAEAAAYASRSREASRPA
jgi:DNA-binding CsgD family transcriptional regulator